MLESLRGLPGIRGAFQARLAEIPGIRVHPGAANFFLVELLDTRLDASRLFDRVARAGFLMRVCDSFHGLRPGAFLRLAVRTEKENTTFAEVFARAVETERTAA